MLIKPILKLIAKILTIIIYLVTLFSAFGGKVNPEYFTLPAIMTLLLPYISILCFIAAVAWLCQGKIITGAMGILTILVSWGPISSAVPLHFSRSAQNEENTFSLLTYNILHGDDFRDPDSPVNRSFEFVINSGADIVCLQEIREFSPKEIKNFSKSLQDQLAKAYPYSAGDLMTDVKILSKYPVKLIDTKAYPRTRVPNGYATRADFYRLNVKGRQLTIVNIHFNSYQLTEEEREVVTEINSVNSAKKSIRELKGTIWSKMSQNFKMRAGIAKDVREAIEELHGAVIVCGDLNDVPASYAYRTLLGEDLKDAYSETNFGPTYTYNAHMFLFHIDQILYKGDLRALSVKREKIKTSDHYPLIAEFEFTDPEEKK